MDENPYRSPESEEIRSYSIPRSLVVEGVVRAVLVFIVVASLITIVSHLMLIRSAPHLIQLGVSLLNSIVSISAGFWAFKTAVPKRNCNA